MLLTVPLREKVQSRDSRKRQRHEKVEPGSIVQGRVVEAHALHVDVQLANGGRMEHHMLLHVCSAVQAGSLRISSVVRDRHGSAMS
jgi:hypothetical protein